MDRRQFLRAALSLAPAAIIVPPVVSYFLAPRGGWPGFEVLGHYTTGMVFWGNRAIQAALSHEHARDMAEAMRRAWETAIREGAPDYLVLNERAARLGRYLVDPPIMVVPREREWLTLDVA